MMTFTITNMLPRGQRLARGAFDRSIDQEFEVTFDGVTVGGATLTHAINLGDRVTLVFQTDGLTGLAVQGLPAVTS